MADARRRLPAWRGGAMCWTSHVTAFAQVWPILALLSSLSPDLELAAPFVPCWGGPGLVCFRHAAQGAWKPWALGWRCSCRWALSRSRSFRQASTRVPAARLPAAQTRLLCVRCPPRPAAPVSRQQGSRILGGCRCALAFHAGERRRHRRRRLDPACVPATAAMPSLSRGPASSSLPVLPPCTALAM